MAKFPKLSKVEATILNGRLNILKEIHSTNIARMNLESKKAISEFSKSVHDDARDSANHAIKKHQLLNHMYQENFHNNPLEGILSKIENTNYHVTGQSNLDSISVRTRNLLAGRFSSNLRERGLLKYAGNPKNTADIAKANDRLNKSFENSINPAEQVAWAIAEINSNIIRRLQRAGSSIEAHKGFLWSQSHNQDSILENTQVWANDIVDELDWDKSFGTGAVKNREEALELLEKFAVDIESVGYKNSSRGPGRPTKQGKRQFIFNDSASWIRYNEKHGYYSLLEGVQKTIDNASKQIALLEVFGPNQLGMVRELIDEAARIQPRSKKATDRKVLRTIQDAMDLYSGLGNRPGEGAGQTAYKAVTTGKLVTGLGVLGKSVFPAMEDIATSIVVMKRITGKPIPVIAANTLFDVIKSLPSGEVKKAAKMYDVAIHGMEKEMMEAIGSMRSSDGKLQKGLVKGLDVLMVTNGTTLVTNKMRVAATESLSLALTNMVTKKKPNKTDLESLGVIGLSDKEVSLLRDMLKSTGHDRVSPSMVRNSDLPPIQKQLLESKIGAYYVQNVNKMSPIASNKEKRQMGRHLPQDSFMRSFAETFSLFLGTVQNIHNTVIQSARASNPKGELATFSTAASVAQTLLILGTMKYAADRIKGFIVDGDDLLEEDDEAFTKNFANALLNSGAAGLYGSFIVEALTHSGSVRVSSPLIKVPESIYKALDSGDPDKFLRTLYRFVPYQNHILLDNEIRRNLLPLN